MLRNSTLKRSTPLRAKAPMKRGTAKLPAKRKTVRSTKTMYRNLALLKLAEGMPCKLAIPGVCCGDVTTVVACHSNQSRHGKAGWLKAHDWATAWGCRTCHHYIDQSRIPSYEEKVALWEAGFMETRLSLIVLGKWPYEAEIGYMTVYGVRDGE